MFEIYEWYLSGIDALDNIFRYVVANASHSSPSVVGHRGESDVSGSPNGNSGLLAS